MAQETISDIEIKDLYVRDPYIVAHKPTQTYYLYKSSMVASKKRKTRESFYYD